MCNILIIFLCSLKQVERHEERLNDAVHEMAKPLARYKDDKDLDKLLKSQDREGDPMLQMLSKKKAKNAVGGSKLKKKIKLSESFYFNFLNLNCILIFCRQTEV